jgi:hypothetical protein
MTTAPCAGPARYTPEAITATSNSQGTVLPRSGVFWGVRPPRYHSAVIIDELVNSWTGETQVRGWFESHRHLPEQTSSTSSQTERIRLMNFEIDVSMISSWSYSDLTSSRSATNSYAQAGIAEFIREVDVACVFVPKWNDLTESPWRDLENALAPLRAAPRAILEAIRKELERNKGGSKQPQHTGLAAVEWLTGTLGLSRPTILRMGGVPESTFYAWRNNPQAVVRAPSVSRILRFQAQVGLLDKALGRGGMKAWIMSEDHLRGLQGDDATFMQTLAEAEAAVKRETQITPRRRMRLEDYEFNAEQPADFPADELPSWPGASKLPDELAE